MPRKARIAMPAAFLLAVLASAQQVQVREEMLANGMKVLLVERHDSPTVSCGWVARVGSVNEAPGITGISHLFEHMMFKGTKAIGTTDFARDAEILKQQDAIRSQMEKEYTLLRERARRGEIVGSIYDPANMTPALKELKGQLEKLYAAEKEVVVSEELEKIYTREGASGSNAGTTEDQTFYFVTLPANKLQLWFWMESDRLLNPVFREFYSERDVVREERRLRVESTPTGTVDEAFEAMFWQSSPYSHPVVGWPSDVESISRAQAERYFSIYYAPNDITAVLVGDFDPTQALALARQYFERIPHGAVTPPEMITTEVSQVAERRLVAEADTNPEVGIRYHTVPFNHRDSFALELLADLLNKRTGRLYKALVEGQGAAVGEPSAYYRGLKYEGYIELRAEVKEGRKVEEVEAALLAELAKLDKEPVSERELQKVKNQELANSFRRLQSNMSLLFQCMLYDSLDNWRYINTAPAKVQAVTAGDIQRVVHTYLTPEKRNVEIYLRKAGAAAEDPELAAMPPQVKAMVAQQVAEFERMTDVAKLAGTVAQMRQMAGQAPPQMKPAIQYLIKKAQDRLDALQSGKTPPKGGSGPQG